MESNMILSVFKSARNPGHRGQNVIFCISLILAMMVLFPLMGHAFEGSLEKDVQKDLEQGQATVETIQKKLQTGSSVSAEIAQLKKSVENIKISNLLMEERFKLREEKVKSLGAKAVDRHEAMVKGYRKALAEYLALIDKLPSDGTIKQSAVDKLQSLLNKLLPKKHRPIIGSLPYKHLNYPAVEPSTAAAITPAYKGGNKIVSPDDTKSTPEAPISKEIAELAQSLNWQPVAEYEYVKNSIETEWYWGCQKGAEETLRQKSGNDCDQALLLSSLLKASGFPTRLVRGNIQFFASDDKPIERIKNLIGIDDPAQMAEFFQKAGIPYKPIIAGGKIANFQIEHVWIDSLIPMANYRGAVTDEHGKTWIGLDTSIKVKGYEYNLPQDIFENAALSSQLSSIRNEYLSLDLSSQPSTTQPATPLEYLQSSINSELQTQNSPLAYVDFQRTRVLLPEVMNILPSSTQFTLIKATNEYTSLPDELLHKIRFIATNPQLANSQFATNSLFDITLPLYQLSNQQVAITYEPETVEDQVIIDSYGGLDNTPSYLIRLRPVLKINGERIVVATDGLPMGADYILTMELYSPSVNEGATPAEMITNTMITGNLTVIGITAGKAVITPSPLAGEGGGEGEKDAERLLYESAQHYIDRENQAEDELASLFHLSIARPLPTVVTLAGMIDVTYLLDMPHGFTWKGVFVDADLRAIEAVHRTLTPDNRTLIFTQLSSLQGSILENRIFEDDFKVESISTAKLFQLVTHSAQPGTSIITIDKTNIDAILPALSCDDSIKEDITNSVNQNYTIKIPESELTYHDWIGTGYMKENIESGESGWMLSGEIAGGCPVDAVWLETHFQNTLSHPYAGIVNNDPLSAAWLRKIAATDEQPIAAVNSVLPKPLAVFVADSKGAPVPDASVTFKIIAGGGMLQCLNAAGGDEGPLSETNCIATSGANGIARAKLTLGKSTDANPQYIMLNPGDEFSTQIGVNLVTATASGYSGELQLDQPFAQYSKPTGPNKMVKLNGDGAAWYVNNPVGSLRVKVLDQYDNVVSNVTVTFSAQPAESIDPLIALPTVAQGFRNIEFYKSEECNPDKHIGYPLYGDCVTYYGGQTGVSVKTEYFGAVVNAVLGNTVNTKYKVKATAQSIQSAPTFTTFTLTSYGSRENADGYFAPSLQITHFELYNGQGELVNAAKVGTELKAPLTAALALYSCETITEGPYQCTINNQQTNCWKVTSNGIIKTEKIIDGTVTFTPKDGNGLVTATTITNGQYQTRYTPGANPAKNTIEAFGEAEVSVPEVFYDTANDWSASRTAVPVNQVVAVKSGQVIAFEKDSGQAHTGMCGVDPATNQVYCAYDTGQYDKVTYTVFGVNAALTIEPEIVLLNDEGYSTVDTTFKYTILPPEYNAIIADVDIYKTDANNADEWINYIPGDKTQGQGTASFVQGSKFDINILYKAQVLLNRGTDIEITSDRKEIPLAQLNLLTEENPSKTPDEIKFGDGTRLEKKYRMEFLSRALLDDCSSLSGKIIIMDKNGLPVAVPGAQDEYYLSEYPLEFPEAFFGGCRVRIRDLTDNGNLDQYLVLSNKSRADLGGGILVNPALIDTVVLYGGIGNTFKVEVNDAKKYLPIEPVGVVVLGIDGLRQDMLYPPQDSGEEVTASYNDPNGCGQNTRCYVEPTKLKGLCDVLGGKRVPFFCDTDGWENKHIKLSKVTAIFPSITFASWASIFTGKLPKETGITGQEFFARDLIRYDNGTATYSWSKRIPGLESQPPGIMALDATGLAFKPEREKKFALENVVPSELSIFGVMNGSDTLQEKTASTALGAALQAEPLWSEVNDTVKSAYQISPTNNVTKCEESDYECRTVSIFNQYATSMPGPDGNTAVGADRWGTLTALPSNVGDYFSSLFNLTKMMDMAAVNEAESFINRYFTRQLPDGKRKRFPAVFSTYFSALDHSAHEEGMGEYSSFFTNTTDGQVKNVVDALKIQDEFDNKIFIVVADHGHTAMPTGMMYIHEAPLYDTETGDFIRINQTNRDAEMSCTLKTNFAVNSKNEYAGKNAKNSERENNNLHIWELGEVMRGMPTGELTPEGKKMYYKVLAPTEIVDANKGETATTDLKQASVIATLNGPMAHIYVKGANDWYSDPQSGLLIKVARLLNAAFAGGDGPIPRLGSSIQAILIRLTQNSEYVVYNGATYDAAGQITLNAPIPLATYFSDSQKYIDALDRIAGMNHPERSGDIVLIMKDATTGDAADRYTTGVACKSWHGSLNPSDSYVPFIVSYPGGNKLELNPLIQKVCADNLCEGNWKAKDLISEIIKTQYPGL